MAMKMWQIIRTKYCDHAGEEVSLEAQTIYPAEWMAEQPPRVVAHRCSNGVECNAQEKAACVWSGTNPFFDPFLTK